MSTDAPKKARNVDRNRSASPSQRQRGDPEIMAQKLWKRADDHEVAYVHPGCCRTSNDAVDRPMNQPHRAALTRMGIAAELAAILKAQWTSA